MYCCRLLLPTWNVAPWFLLVAYANVFFCASLCVSPPPHQTNGSASASGDVRYSELLKFLQETEAYMHRLASKVRNCFLNRHLCTSLAERRKHDTPACHVVTSLRQLHCSWMNCGVDHACL